MITRNKNHITVHFAKLTNGGLPGSDTVIDAYENEDADFHQIVADMAGIDRKTAKAINLGMMYGMGKGKLGSELDLDEEDTADLWKQYHKRVPFVKELADKVSARAQDVGYIRTLLGRKCRFDLWEQIYLVLINHYHMLKQCVHMEKILEEPLPTKH